MGWLNKKKMAEIKPDSKAKVEIVAHQKATKREVDKVQKANDALNNLFDDNHFTLKIYLSSKE